MEELAACVSCSESEASRYLSTLLPVIMSENSAFFMVLHTFQFFYVPLVLQMFVFFLYILSDKQGVLILDFIGTYVGYLFLDL